MKSIFIVDTYYQQLIDSFGTWADDDFSGNYQDTLEQLLGVGFGTGGAYLRELRSLGWEAQISIPNAQKIQTNWLFENQYSRPVPFGWPYGIHLARLPFLNSVLHKIPHVQGTLLKQIELQKPDVVFVQDLNLIPPSMAKEIKKYTRLLVGEIASPLPPQNFFRNYDLIFSALPSIIDKVRNWGGSAQYLPLGFDGKWADLAETNFESRTIDAVFVGSFSRHQPQTIPLLQKVANSVPTLKIYGNAPSQFLQEHGLLEYFQGPAWGRHMFEILGKSKLVINRHGTIAGNYAVNMRMFEATGMGAGLVTENKSNLSDLFIPGEEVISYETPDQAAELTKQLLSNQKALSKLATKGNQKTLQKHTYAHRALELSQTLDQMI